VAAVRAPVDDALAAWDERALVGAVAPVEDRPAFAKSVLGNVAGLGPLQHNTWTIPTSRKSGSTTRHRLARGVLKVPGRAIGETLL
jgi:hypothetical protein